MNMDYQRGSMQEIKTGLNLALTMIEKIEASGGGMKDLEFLVSPAGESAIETFLKEVVIAGSDESYFVPLNYDDALVELIHAGEYRSINPEITENNFRHTDETRYAVAGEIEMKLFQCPKRMRTENVLATIQEQTFRPAEIKELLALGVKYPMIQLRHPVIALGTLWEGPNGYRGVAGLWGHSGNRYLDLTWYDGNWNDTYRFAAVKT